MTRNPSPENYFEVSRFALQRNARAVRDYVAVPVIGVVKCDGYGVSLLEAALAWKQAGAAMFAVSLPQEAVTLRQAGFQEDILLLSPVTDRETLADMMACHILLPVTGLECARFYSRYATGAPLRVHVAVDTGMGRFGVRWTDREQLLEIYNTPNLRFEGIYSHLAKSFEPQYAMTGLQLERFLKVTAFLTEAGLPVGMRHIANSCAALRFPQTWLDAVRVGSALVGALCAESPLPLVPVGTFRARVVDKKFFQRGDTTGYGAFCKIRRPTTAVMVAVGTGDGFGVLSEPDHLRLRDFLAYLYHLLQRYVRRPCVTFHGKTLPILGRVGHQYTLFDATGVDIHPGDYVNAQVPRLFPHRNRVFR